jgi:hypothetical protein
VVVIGQRQLSDSSILCLLSAQKIDYKSLLEKFCLKNPNLANFAPVDKSGHACAVDVKRSYLCADSMHLRVNKEEFRKLILRRNIVKKSELHMRDRFFEHDR